MITLIVFLKIIASDLVSSWFVGLQLPECQEVFMGVSFIRLSLHYFFIFLKKGSHFSIKLFERNGYMKMIE